MLKPKICKAFALFIAMTAATPVIASTGQNLETTSGIDLAFQLSDYRYEEPSLNVKLGGQKFGFDTTAAYAFGNDWFVGGELRNAFGFSEYKGSGTLSGNFENLFDVRGVVGKDFRAEPFVIAPYLGLGYRDFYSDDRGTTSTGASGYRRENQLYYIPVGVEPRFHVSAETNITANLEYDYVVRGKQTSKLSDANAGFPDISNNQKSGYGFRGNLMWETNKWAAGPFFNYWNIQQSDTSCATSSTLGLCGYEPTNNTLEAGLQFRYHLF